MTLPQQPRRLVALALLIAGAASIVALTAYGLVGTVPRPPDGLVRPPVADRDLDAIIRSGLLRVAFVPDDVGFSERSGHLEGQCAQLAAWIAGRLDLELVVLRSPSPAQALRLVSRGEADIAAFADPGPEPILDAIAWGPPIREARPVVVGRGARAIRGLHDLAGRTIVARQHSRLASLARTWSRRVPGQIRLQLAPADATVRSLAQSAASGEAPLILLDERRAVLEARVFGPLEVSAPLDEPLPVRWATRPNAEQFQARLAELLATKDATRLIARLEGRYFDDPARLKSRRRPLLRTRGPILSPYDDVFRGAGARQDFDWRLLAAVSFAESGYDRWEVSSSGAMGLLQLMPNVAAAYGADDPFDPHQNVQAGARYLRWLYDRYESAAAPDRLAFALAAYNMGHGHLDDARLLALERGFNPHLWRGHVARVLPLLEDETVARGLKHGRARGRTTLHYVERVFELYGGFTGTTVAYASGSAASGRADS